MSVYSKSFIKLSRKAIIPLVFVFLFQFVLPIKSLVVRADDITNAQQQEIQTYIDAQQLRNQIRAEADSLRNSILSTTSTTNTPEQPSQPSDASQPTEPAPTSGSGTGDSQPITQPTQPSQPESTSQPTTGTGDQQSTSQPTPPSQPTQSTDEQQQPAQPSQPQSSGGSGTPFSNLTNNLHSPTTELDISTSATTTATSTPGISINNQGDDNVTQVGSNTNDSTTIDSQTSSDVTNKQTSYADSGNNTITCNGICEGKLVTGSATADTTNGNKVNTNNISSGGSGFTMPWVRYGFGPNSGIENGGDGAVNIGDNTFVKDLAIIQKNDAFLNNQYNVVTNTGGNDLLTTFKLKDFDALTGNALSRLTLMNMVNTSMIDSEWWPLYIGVDKQFNSDINVMDELLKQFGQNAKFNLFDPNATATINNSGDDAFNKLASDIQYKVNTSSENAGIINNKITVAANTGHNTASSPYKIKDFNLQTGDAESALTLMNFLNTYLVNSQWAVTVINVFGDWTKDLILPSPDELLNIAPAVTDNSGVSISTAGADSFTKVLVNDRTDQNVFIKNDTNVKTRINTVSSTGGDFIGFTDDIENTAVKTGAASAVSNQFTIGGATKVNGGFFNMVINDLSKQWNGTVEGAPDDAHITRDQNGVTITAERGLQNPASGITINGNRDAVVNNSGDDAMNIAEINRTNQVTINSNNSGSVVNDINIEAYSGDNLITGLTGKNINVKTGNTKTATTIGNVVNTTMVGAKAMNVIVNVFGDWNGKVVFGKSIDLLSIITSSKSGNLSPGETVTYTVDYQNSNDKEATKNTKLTAQYDASKMELIDNGGATESPVGTLTWNIGDVAAGGSGQKTFRVRVKSPLPIGNHTISATSNITSERPESNKENNVDTTSNSVTVAGGGGPTPPSNTGEGTVTGSAQQGNQGSNNQGTGNTNGQQSSGNQQSNNSNSNSQNPNQGGQFNTPGGSTSSGSSGVTLRITKSANVSSIHQGESVKYTVTLQNTGLEQATNVKVFDKLRVNGVSSPEDEFSWDIGAVPSGETVSLSYDVNIERTAELGTYTNTAYASGFDSRNKVVLSNDSLATVTVTQGSSTVGVSGQMGNGSGNAGGSGANQSNNELGITNDGTNQPTASNQQSAGILSSPNAYSLTPNASGNHSEPKGVTITHPDGTTEVLGNGSGRSVRSTPNITRGVATINRAVLLSGALEAQAQTVNDAPITNTNGPAELIAMASMDQVLGDQIARERNYNSLMVLWFILLLLLVVVGYLAWREQKKGRDTHNTLV